MNMKKIGRLVLGSIVFLLGCYLSVLEIGITYSEWQVLQSSKNMVGALVAIALIILIGFGLIYGGIRIMKGSK